MESLISELPEWARALFYVSMAIGGAIVFLVGKNRAPPAPEETEAFSLKAAMVDNRAVDRLSGEITGQSLAITEQTRVSREGIEIMRRQNEALVDLRDELKELRHEMRQRR